MVSLHELIHHLKIRMAEESRGLRRDPTTPQLRDLRASAGEFFFITHEKKRADAISKGHQPTDELRHGQMVTKGLIRDEGKVTPEDALREAQEILAERGYTPGRTDGKTSIRTSVALRKFQLENNLAPTGDLDAETRTAFEVALMSLSDLPHGHSDGEDGCDAKLRATPTFKDRRKDNSKGPLMMILDGGAFTMGVRPMRLAGWQTSLSTRSK